MRKGSTFRNKYDLNGDGIIDSLVSLHSGYPSEIGDVDCTNDRVYQNRIWSHAIGTFADKRVSADGQYSLGEYMVASALRGTCSGDLARILSIRGAFPICTIRVVLGLAKGSGCLIS